MLVVEPSDSAYNVSIHQAPLPEHSVRIVVLIIHSSDPPIFLKGREVNFNYLPRKGEYEKIQKGGGSMGQGQIFLKEGGWHFSYLIFQGLPFLHLEITLPFAKLCYAFEEKLFLPP